MEVSIQRNSCGVFINTEQLSSGFHGKHLLVWERAFSFLSMWKNKLFCKTGSSGLETSKGQEGQLRGSFKASQEQFLRLLPPHCFL